MSTRVHRKAQCSDPRVGKRLYLEVREKAPHHEQLQLDQELQEHARTCPHCSELLPLWILSAGGGLAAAAENVLREAKQGSSQVLHARRGNLDVYFRRQAPDSKNGLMVSVREDGSLASVDETTIDEFPPPELR
jgi:hypothetical protein